MPSISAAAEIMYAPLDFRLAIQNLNAEDAEERRTLSNSSEGHGFSRAIKAAKHLALAAEANLPPANHVFSSYPSIAPSSACHQSFDELQLLLYLQDENSYRSSVEKL